MKALTRSEIEAAEELLRDILVPTRLVPLQDDPRTEPRIWLKPEIHQVIGSFKIRGVFHAVARLPEEERARGLSTVSAGNTAQALAWCGRHFGVPARSLMPETAPETKIRAVRALGGTPVLVPVAEVFRYLREAGWESEPYAFVHPWTERNVVVGHASLGLEILRDLPEADTVVVPVGGGGLLAGVGGALRAAAASVRVVAVEPAGCPAFHAAHAAGSPVDVPCNTICDGVAVPYLTDEMFPLLDELADEIVLVSEDDVRATIRRLAGQEQLIVEGAGALALAATLTAGEDWGRTVCLLTGGSIDAARLSAILS